MEKLPKLLTHSFVAKQQMIFLKKMKDELPTGHVIALGDFSQNYSFVIQDEVQGYHWNNDQASIHPYVYYYRNSKGELENGNYVPISECKDHDTALVYLFQNDF